MTKIKENAPLAEVKSSPKRSPKLRRVKQRKEKTRSPPKYVKDEMEKSIEK